MYDVVIVGASVSGCATAIDLGRAGLRVAVLEKHRNPATPKGPCGHFILGGSHEALVSLGAWDPLVANGACASEIDLCTDAGWLAPRTRPLPPALNARRSLLDPTLRSVAASTPGVELHLGVTVTGLLTTDERVTGVTARLGDGGSDTFAAHLVVAADGHRSPTATFAGVPATTIDNPRAFAYGYLRPAAPLDRSLIWALGDTWYVVSPTDDGLVEVVVMPPAPELPSGSVPISWILSRLADLPGAPDLTSAQPVGKVVVARNYPPSSRNPTPRPGLALVGDAAITGDPTPAVGITWALRSAGWLASAVADNHRAGRDLSALAAYDRAHAALRRDFRFQNGDTRRLTPNPVQRMLWRGATRDAELSWQVGLVGNQLAPVTSLLRPSILWRAATARTHTKQQTLPAKAGRV